MTKATFPLPNSLREEAELREAIAKLPGVRKVSVELHNNWVFVEFDAPATFEQIEEILHRI